MPAIIRYLDHWATTARNSAGKPLLRVCAFCTFLAKVRDHEATIACVFSYQSTMSKKGNGVGYHHANLS
ncbi:hypothetical protein TNCV_3132981 [Trichonephila clavipes]|nr:hypothetical protein TNCV_3132981 [Trichonephila clavipes]